MNRFISSLLILVALVASSEGFAPSSLGGISGGELLNKVHEFPLHKTDCNILCLGCIMYCRRVPYVIIYMECFRVIYTYHIV